MDTPVGAPVLSSVPSVSRWPGVLLALLLTACFFGGLIAAGHLHKYHLDEAYYTDAALQMRQSGDLFTPRWEDGRPRFFKPIYTYWLVLAAFSFGPGMLAARAPFLLLTTFVVWLTFVLARRIHGRSETALLAAVLLLSNLLFMDATGHALPDTPLLAGITLSHLGFIGILLLGRRSWVDYLCAYGGAGLAIGSKGLSGLLPALFALLFVAWGRWRARRSGAEAPTFRALWHGPAVAVGLGLGLWWFAVEYNRYGSMFLSAFFDDQIVRKLERSVWWVNLPTYLIFSFGSFFPWVILLLPRFRRKGTDYGALTRAAREIIPYAVGFALLVVLVYTPGNITYERYMLPAAPLLAIAWAGLLAPAYEEKEGAVRPVPWLTGMFYALVVPVMLLAVVLLIQAHAQGLERLSLGCGLVLGGGAVLCLIRRWRPALTPMALGCFVLLLTFVYENQVRPTYRTSPARGILEVLEARGAHDVLLIGATKGLDSQLRVISGGRIRVEDRPADGTCATGDRLQVFPEGLKGRFSTDAFELVRVSYAFQGVNLRKFIRAFRQGQARAFLEERREWYWLAVPKTDVEEDHR